MAPKLYMAEGSAVVRSVLLTEAAIGISLDYIHVDLEKGQHLTSEFLKLNPLHTIPTLVDDGKAIFESAAINIYLVEKYAKDKSFYPSDPYEKALVNEILFFCSNKFFPTAATIIRPIMLMGATTINPEDVDRLIEVYGLLETLLKGRVWAAGDKVTLADFALIPLVSGSEVVAEYDRKQFPNIIRYLEKAKSLPYYNRNQKGDEMFKTEVLRRLNRS
uniref:Glutathione transferase n=1 Tax=Photinus pyralis TaxID=7054 RepID=A0A1Y1KQ51_PHOPY